MALLDMSNIPNQMISGLSSDELQWITEESCDRMIKELDPDIFKDIDEFVSENEYAELPEEIISELSDAEKSATPKGTQNQTNAHVRKFKTFLKDKGLSEDIEVMALTFSNEPEDSDLAVIYCVRIVCTIGLWHSQM